MHSNLMSSLFYAVVLVKHLNYCVMTCNHIFSPNDAHFSRVVDTKTLGVNLDCRSHLGN